ncbi:MAG: LysM peptidoglycan-binding domain-containing protein [Ardenticatenia bacterium]|nr:LysM peptidoglycan-binding domain-containing protein [Ardenticatenia bacterium]
MRSLRMMSALGLLAALFSADGAAAAPSQVTYTIRPGDTLGAIGARCGVGYQQIAAANGITNPNVIEVGKQLNIPGSKGCSNAAVAAPVARAAAAPSAAGSAAVPAAPVAAGAPAGFGYGVQVHAPDGDQGVIERVKGMRFNWVKQQVEWFRYEGAKGERNFSGLENLVNQANANGVNVMFSVVKAPDWARPGNTDRSVAGPPANPQDMADFMSAMAAHFRGRVKAYEIWNEQNLHYEWGNEPLSAGRYSQLLCANYRAIKAADPGAMVISGALTPTGVNDGSRAIDDVNYLSQMMATGSGGCANGIGAHPSGYNNPATVQAGWNNPAEPQFKGHRSFFFRSTLEAYRGVMNRYGQGAKKLWVTEFGWASVDNLGTGPAGGYEYAAQNTEGEQAQYLRDAFNLARSWGWVGPMFVWNLNFAPVAGNGDEKAAFGLVRGDWSERPAFQALRDMPK